MTTAVIALAKRRILIKTLVKLLLELPLQNIKLSQISKNILLRIESSKSFVSRSLVS